MAGGQALAWSRFRGDGGTWQAVLCTPDHPALEGGTYVGRMLPDDRTLYIAAHLPWRKVKEVFLHELLHEAFLGCGLTERTEEKAVLHLETALLPRLKQYGFTVPPKPAGYAAFARKARAVAKQCAN